MGSRTRFWGLILAMLAVGSIVTAPGIPVPSRSQLPLWGEDEDPATEPATEPTAEPTLTEESPSP